jgi:hypothetical protein
VPSQPPGQTLVAVDPTAIEDTALQTGSQITFSINVTNAPPINGFYVSLLYNTTILSVAKNGLNTQQSVLLQTGGQLYPVVECVDGFTVAGTSCTPYVDTNGVISVWLNVAPGTTPNPTNGLLFSVTFNVIATGVDQIHFLRSTLLNGSTNTPANQPVDGFFSNKMCGSQFCKYPVVHVDVTPPVPFELSPAVHNASLTSSPNPGAKIIAYSWTWDGPSVFGYNLDHFENSSRVVTVTYHATYNYTLIVGAIDSFGITGYTSKIVSVINFIINVGVYTLTADPQQGVPVGTPVTIGVVPENAGTQPENVTLRLFIEGQGEVKNQNYTLQRFCFNDCIDAKPMIYHWDTSKLAPKAYLVQAKVDHIKGDNDTSNDLYLAYVQIVVPLGPSTVSLSLLSTASISIIALIAVGAAVLILRPKPKDEPLEQETSGST